MGYYTSSMESNIKIKVTHKEDLKQAIFDWLDKGDKSWISKANTINQTDILDIIKSCHYYAEEDDEFIYIYYFDGEKWGSTDDEFPDVIAPFVEDNCEISFRGEDDTIWKYVFKDGECKEVSGEIIIKWEE